MARSYSAGEGNRAMSVQARTYPKVWADGTVGDILKEAERDQRIAPDEAKEWAKSASKVGFVDEWAMLYPTVVPNAVEKSIEIVKTISNDLKQELPAHTINFGSARTRMVVEEKGGVKEYRMDIAYRSPAGKTDVRSYRIGTDNEPLAKAVEQLVMEHGMDRREFIDGEAKFIEERRQKD